MAKKKKSKKQDIRGYSNGQQQQQHSSTTTKDEPPTTTTTTLTSSAEQMTNLEEDQQSRVIQQTLVESSPSPPPPTVCSSTGPTQQQPQPSDRSCHKVFAKRLATIYDRLTMDGKFTHKQLERVVKALGFAIMLESALDWLCSNLSTRELPLLFRAGDTEGEIVLCGDDDRDPDDEQRQTNIEVLVPPVPVPTTEPTTKTTKLTMKDHEDNKQEQNNLLLQSSTVVPLPESRNGDRDDNKHPRSKSDGGESSSNSNKAWILQQYQYEQDNKDGDNDEEYDNKESDLNNHMISTPAGSKDDSTDTTTAAAASNGMDDPDEKTSQYSLLELELEQIQLDLQDEAANYLRSKHEVKALQQRKKQLQKQLAAAKRRRPKQQQQQVDKNRKNQQQQQQQLVAQPKTQVVQDQSCNQEAVPDEADVDGGEEDDDDGLLLFSGDLFDEETAAVEAAASASTTATTPTPPTTNTNSVTSSSSGTVLFPDESIPKNWTGKTPRMILEDYCVKHRIPKPVYSVDRKDGCKVTLKSSTALSSSSSTWSQEKVLVAEVPGPLLSSDTSAAKEYVATVMLYRLQPDLPLYRLLPPFFADLWRMWLNDERRVKDEIKEAEKNERNQMIQSLIQLIDVTPPPSTSASSSEVVRDANDQLYPVHVPAGATLAGADDPLIRSVNSSSSNMINENHNDSINNNTRFQNMFLERCKSESYRKMLRVRSALPIFPYRERILDSIDNNAVTVLCAETGAGKTTNCGQFILEEALRNGTAANILCTQPRRVAATSVAERVAEEMCEPSIGRLVGYQIRLESRKSSHTRLLFCTTGVVLRRLVDDPSLNGVTHVLVDEVHERQWQVDVLLISLRKLLLGPRPDLKVVLMSATLDAELFCSFFGGAPLVSVPGRTFPVSSYYLEDLLEETSHAIERGSFYARRETNWDEASFWVTTRGGEKKKETQSVELELELSGDFAGYSVATQRSMDRVDEQVINYDLIEDLLKVLLIDPLESRQNILPPSGADLSSGSVLVFLPGIGEIRTLTERLVGSRVFGRGGIFDIIPMHSSLSSTDQRRAFCIAPKGVRKIVLATNIAETSVTIPDVVYVIDSGRVRELQHDKRTSTPKLVLTWCSRASTKQRAGRAGRVQPGICLKLFSSKTEMIVMKELSEPELMRIPLEEVCLNILATGLAKQCKAFLAQAPQCPAEKSVDVAVDHLKEIGAVSCCQSSSYLGSLHGDYETLTPLGRHLAQLPVDARLGKMLIYGALFKCIDPIATIAACLSASKSVFASSMKDNSQAKASQSRFRHPVSDFLTLVEVYKAFTEADSAGNAKMFCQQHFLNLSSLREIRDGKILYIDLLCGIGFLDRERVGFGGKGGRNLDHSHLASCCYNVNGRNETIVHSIIFAGVYPNIAKLLDQRPSGKAPTLEHKAERLEIHSSSINFKLPIQTPSMWVAFDEKFGTDRRVSVSTTCFVDPISILLFANSLVVKHFERKVIVDSWIELGVAAQTAVMIQNIRKELDRVLKDCFDLLGSPNSRSSLVENQATATVDEVVSLLTSVR